MSLRIQIEIDEVLLRRLILNHLSKELHTDLQEMDVLIEVKSKRNYKAEWESAAFRARVDKYIP